MTSSKLYFYQGMQPSTILGDQSTFTLFRNSVIPLAELGHTDNVSTTLLNFSDGNNSVLNTSTGRSLSYTPFGHAERKQDELFHQAFNGQIQVPLESFYLLGNGRRTYNPALMRFCSADTDSPFASGGINAYVYCGDDPINYSDPSARTRVKNGSSIKVPYNLRPTRKASGFKTRPQPKTKTKSIDEKFDLANELIKDENIAPGVATIDSAGTASFFKDARQAPHHPWIKKQPEHLRPSAEERNAITAWARNEKAIDLPAAVAWLEAQVLEIDPVHRLSTAGYELTAAKQAHRIISDKIHKIRFGY